MFLLTLAALYGLGMVLASVFLLLGPEAWHLTQATQEPVNFVSGLNFPVGRLLVVMLQIVTNGAVGQAQLGFVIVGSSLWAFVMGGIAGLAWSVLDDRERYRMLRYRYVLPGALRLVLLGRGTARIRVAAMGAGITLVAALVLVGSPIDLATVDRPYLLAAMSVGLVAVVALGATMGAIVMQTRQDSWDYPEAVAGALSLLVEAVFPLSVLPAVAQGVGLLEPLTWWIEFRPGARAGRRHERGWRGVGVVRRHGDGGA